MRVPAQTWQVKNSAPSLIVCRCYNKKRSCGLLLLLLTGDGRRLVMLRKLIILSLLLGIMAFLPGCVTYPGYYYYDDGYYYESYYPYSHGPYFYSPFFYGTFHFRGDFTHRHGFYGHRGSGYRDTGGFRRSGGRRR